MFSVHHVFLQEDGRKEAIELQQGYRSGRWVIISICTVREMAGWGLYLMCSFCWFFLLLWLLEKCHKCTGFNLFCPLTNFLQRSCPANKCKTYLISLFHLTLMLKVSVFHSTCIPHPAVIQPSHTVCSGDSGTSSLPSSSTASCRKKNESSLFPSFSDHYTSYE